MIDLDALQEISVSLTRHKLRTALTALGVFLGILIFSLMVAFGPSLEGGVRRQMAGFATNAVMLWGGRTSLPYAGLPPNRPITYDNGDIAALAGIDGIERLAPRNQLGGWRSGNVVRRGSKTGSFQVAGDYPDMQYIQVPIMHAGRFIDDLDIRDRRKVAVIGEAVAEQLFGDDEPIGAAIEIRGVYFVVIGVFGTRISGQRGDQVINTIHVPFTTFQQAFNAGDRVAWFAITGKPSVSAEEIERRAKQALALRHKVAPDDDDAIGSWNAGKDFAKQAALFTAINWVLAVAGLFSLLAGVVGVSNIMLISVRERTKEIGVRKALGATPGSVIGMVVSEAVVLTTIAGYLGLVAGVASVQVAAYFIGRAGPDLPLAPPQLSVGFAGLATVVLIAAGAVAGFIPALRAAAIQPVAALRDE